MGEMKQNDALLARLTNFQSTSFTGEKNRKRHHGLHRRASAATKSFGRVAGLDSHTQQ